MKNIHESRNETYCPETDTYQKNVLDAESALKSLLTEHDLEATVETLKNASKEAVEEFGIRLMEKFREDDRSTPVLELTRVLNKALGKE